jgi:hypothetical protein
VQSVYKGVETGMHEQPQRRPCRTRPEERKHMDAKSNVAAAVAAGYLLGRTKKLKLAITVGSVLAGQRISTNPQKLLKGASGLVQNNPALSALQTELRGRAFDAAKGAAVAVATNRIDKLTDTLRTRGEKKRADKEAPAESEDAAEEPEDQYEEAGDEGGAEETEDQYEEAEQGEEEPEDQYEQGEEQPDEEPEAEYERDEEQNEEEDQPEEPEEQPEPAPAAPVKKVAAKTTAPAKKVAAATTKKTGAKRPVAQKSAGGRAGR